MPFLCLQEAIETAADGKAKEDRQAALNALIAGKWIQPKKSWVNELFYSDQRPDYVAPEMSEEEAIERAWKLIAADRKEHEKKEKK